MLERKKNTIVLLTNPTLKSWSQASTTSSTWSRNSSILSQPIHPHALWDKSILYILLCSALPIHSSCMIVLLHILLRKKEHSKDNFLILQPNLTSSLLLCSHVTCLHVMVTELSVLSKASPLLVQSTHPLVPAQGLWHSNYFSWVSIFGLLPDHIH